jgi:hypothetical protein
MNGRQGIELLKRGISSSQPYGDKFADLQLADWNTNKFVDLLFAEGILMKAYVNATI